MRLAEARRAASIMISCSMITSFTDSSGVVPCVWMMKTSAPRTFSPSREWISPLANSTRFACPSSTPRWSAISSANGRFDRPASRCSLFFVTSSMGPL